MSMNDRCTKFKIGNLIEYKPREYQPQLGVVIGVGLDYSDNGNRRQRYASIRWTDGTKSTLWINHDEGWNSCKVVG